MLKEVSAEEVFSDEQPSNELEVTLQEFDDMVADYIAIKELVQDPNFQRVIIKGYLEEDYDRLTELLKNSGMNTQVSRERPIIVDKITAKGALENWLETTLQSGSGLDNPEQRVQLVKELEAQMAEQERLEDEEA